MKATVIFPWLVISQFCFATRNYSLPSFNLNRYSLECMIYIIPHYNSIHFLGVAYLKVMYLLSSAL